MRAPRPIALIAAAIALGACAGAPGPPGSAQDDPALRFGACSDPGGDWAPPVEFVASVERWLEVAAAPTPPAGDGNVDVPMKALPLGPSGDPTGPVVEEVLRIHASMLPAISWAIGSGGHAYLGLGAPGLERETVLFTLIATAEGTLFFAGARIEEGWNDCTDLGTRQPGLRILGAYLGDERSLEVWLLGPGADLTAPIQLFGTVDASALPDDILGSAGSAAIRVKVSGTMGTEMVGATPILDARVRLIDTERYDVMAADPQRSLDVLGEDITAPTDLQAESTP